MKKVFINEDSMGNIDITRLCDNIGKCKPPEFTQEEDCMHIDIKAQAYKPIESIVCTMVLDGEEKK